MPIAFSTWRPLVPTEITAVPESPGVFEIATLVRTLLHVGTAGENLVLTLTQYLESPHQGQSHTGGLYFRYTAAPDAERLQAELLDAYRQRHGGLLPPAQEGPAPRTRHLKAV